MRKVLLAVVLSLSLLSVGEMLVNPSYSKEELNENLIRAIENENIESIKELISKPQNINSIIEKGNYKGFTPLMFASRNGSKEIVELLVSKGAEPNIFIKEGNYKGSTPLLFSIETDNKELESFLIKNSNSESISYAENIKNKSKYPSIKANIYTITTVVETYAIDFNGKYPEKLEDLEKYAKSNGYWKEIKNPFTEMSGLGKNGSFMDYKTYKSYKSNPSLKGLVLYEAINPKFDKKLKKSFSTQYKIYGTDENGQLLKNKDGKIFFNN